MKNSIIKVKLTVLLVVISNLLTAQNDSNSIARNAIQDAGITMVNRDFSKLATIKSENGVTISFFPIEITDLKTGQITKALQVEMENNCSVIEFDNSIIINRDGIKYTKSSWIDLNEISEFITFLEEYVIPKLSNSSADNKSNTYIFNSKEIVLKFLIGENNNKFNSNKLSIYIKSDGKIDEQCYFWTETRIEKTRELLTVLKSFK